ncbi:MAG: hypothetical protein LBC41_12195 [Clostridiales bacterium]|jgi:hypothetical protein|nr:hypothetical protein [Clostridiales bacterium]MDR2751412.1 hypothetical protein [Clostridiales bacterium]
MRLRAGINYPLFLKEVKMCKGDIFYTTSEGDRFNLRSVLSEFVFVAYALTYPERTTGCVECVNSTDIQVLSGFFEDA